jgi:hypothetical protein
MLFNQDEYGYGEEGGREDPQKLISLFTHSDMLAMQTVCLISFHRRLVRCALYYLELCSQSFLDKSTYRFVEFTKYYKIQRIVSKFSREISEMYDE